jgi:hypothetical protein
LVVGDSGAAFLVHPAAGNIFQKTLDSQGYRDVGVVADEQAAGAGSRADLGASNPKGKLDHLRAVLRNNPTVDIVFVMIGGDDVLRASIGTNLAQLSDEARAKLWSEIVGHIQRLVDAVLACRPNLKVVLCDDDYWNLAETNKSPLKESFKGFHGISQADLNRFMVELGRRKLELVKQRPVRCLYVQNWGLMQHELGDLQGRSPPRTVPLPGGPPLYDPYPGGDPTRPSPARAFDQGRLNDGIHLNAAGCTLVVENALKQGLAAWLKAPPIAPGTQAATKETGKKPLRR